MRRGSVPEILRHGETAMIADDLAGMVAMVDQVAGLDPARLRQEAETRFSVARMVEGYLDAYEMMILGEPESGSLRRRLTNLQPSVGQSRSSIPAQGERRRMERVRGLAREQTCLLTDEWAARSPSSASPRS